MLRSEAARYARWSASIALVLAGITLVVYLQRGWVRHEEKKKAPPPAPVEVARQSNGINFKKVDQNRTIFEISASRSTEFKGKEDNLLEDVLITIFGKAGDRHDVIHTQSCQYGKETGAIECNGQVQITLLSAQDAARTVSHPVESQDNATRIETRGVRFDRATGVAQTDEHVTFAFSNGHGEGEGLEYHSQEGALEIHRNVRMTLAPSSANLKGKDGAKGSIPEVHIRGARLDFARNAHVMHLQGPVEAETSTQRLTAGELALFMDQKFRAEKLVASAALGERPSLTSHHTKDQLELQADTLTADFSPEGIIDKLEAQGQVRGVRTSSSERDEAAADSGSVDMWPRLNQFRDLSLSGSVVLTTRIQKSGSSRSLQTAAFRMHFSGGEAGAVNKPESAETLAPGTMEWTDSVQPGTSASTKLRADKLEMLFEPQGVAKRLTATGNVITERAVTGQAMQTATASDGVVQLQAAGGWSEMELHGKVRLREADRTGDGENALFVRESQTAVLTGNAVARDASTETHAPKLTFFQSSGDIQADGGVRSSDLSLNSGAVQLAPVPANITADSLRASSKSGRAFYSGHARLWQGESVLEADSIELVRPSQVLNAIGNVRGVFPQQSAPGNGNSPVGAAGGSSQSSVPAIDGAQPRQKKPQLWHVSSGTLSYYDRESRAHLEKNVVVKSPDQRMQCPFLELYFTRSTQGTHNVPGSPNAPRGAQQISRAVGTGGVEVEEAGRRATAQNGEYIADTGKFVMSGGNPTIYDGSAGTTTGRQLTFFLADDTIIVDSENGSRTLTKHRVEK
jgi:lipopolysaccharide export system protein LptA